MSDFTDEAERDWANALAEGKLDTPDTQVVDEELDEILSEYFTWKGEAIWQINQTQNYKRMKARIKQLLGQEKIKADTAARIDVMKEARSQMLDIDHGRLSFRVALMNITKAIDQYEAELVQYNLNPKERSE